MGSNISTPILQVRKLRLRGVRQFGANAESHIASEVEFKLGSGGLQKLVNLGSLFLRENGS